MKIKYFGHSCFQLISESGVVVLTDPYKGVGYDLPEKISADIVTISHGHFDHNNLSAVYGVQAVADTPKSFSFGGVEITGEHCWHDPEQGKLRGNNVLFKIKIDGITFCHFGDLGESCCDDILEKIAGSEVLLIPVGGTYTIDAIQAKKYVDASDAKLVIPMHYLPADGTLDIATAEGFLKLSGAYIPCETGEYLLTKADLENKQKKIVYMERVKK